jgi:predicted O-methyltransferase YrrM
MKCVEFEEAWPLACECDIQVNKHEGRLLYDLARQAPENVLEVGSLHGGSAVLMALAGARRLTLIEPHPRQLLLASLARHNLLEEVRILPYPDSLVWGYWKPQISLLFLDHEHAFLPVRNSLVGWNRHLRTGAFVAIHDYATVDEVRYGVDELAPALEIVDKVDNLVVARWRA